MSAIASFQLTRSRGAWLHSKDKNIFRDHFNSHAHVERDQQRPRYSRAWYHFNSHAHVERDRLRLILFPTVYVFQLTRSRGAWPLHSRCHLQILIYFNSHAHVERDDYVKFHIAIFFISTHTLTWSVTANIYAKRGRRYISTHTLTWSVTLSPRPVQSTSLIISTHTLTWSVTDAAPEWICA